MENVFKWLYRTGCYFIPGGTALWCFVIENLLDKEVSVMAKIGCCGVFALILMVIITIFFANKAFTKKNQKLEKMAIKELNSKLLKIGKRMKQIKSCFTTQYFLYVSLDLPC